MKAFSLAIFSSLLWIAVSLLNLWAIAAIYVDCRIAQLRLPLAILYVVAVTFLVIRTGRWKLISGFGCFASCCCGG